jgi:hypothetical protein
LSASPPQLGRWTTAYMPDPVSGTLGVLDEVAGSYWSTRPGFPSAASWLLSTIDDYWAFAQMMWNRGLHNGVTLIPEASVDLMTADQLTRAQRE